MSLALRIRQCLWVALAAVAAALPGTAWASDGARCEAMPAGCTACACCEDAASPAAGVEATPSAIVAPDHPTRGVTVDRPAPRCECRGQDSPAPAEKRGQRTTGRRVETSREVAADSSMNIGPRIPTAIDFRPDVGPPRSPVYLRTMRLLI